MRRRKFANMRRQEESPSTILCAVPLRRQLSGTTPKLNKHNEEAAQLTTNGPLSHFVLFPVFSEKITCSHESIELGVSLCYTIIYESMPCRKVWAFKYKIGKGISLGYC